jgi:hypothetical protein
MSEKKSKSPFEWLFHSALLLCGAVVLLWMTMQLLAQIWIAVLAAALIVVAILVIRAVIVARQQRW